MKSIEELSSFDLETKPSTFDLNKQVEYMNSEKKESTLYDCKKCLNKRVIYKLNEEKNDIVIINCECKTIINNMKLIEKSGMSGLVKYKFNDYIVEETYQKIMKSTAIEYLKTGYINRFSLGFLGQSGTGKTMLCSCVCNMLLEKGIEVVYITYADIKTKFTEGKVEHNFYNEEIQKIRNCEVLYIDDLFKGINNTFHIDVLFELINHRYNSERVTIFSSEFLINDILEINQALGSRIIEMCDMYLVEINKDINKNYRYKNSNFKTI